MIKKISNNELKLCCGGSCAILSRLENYILIKDDFGGEAKILISEALELSEAALLLKDGIDP